MGRILDNKKIANAVLFTATAAFFLALSLRYSDTDLYYLLANGKYILKNGLPKENPFVGTPGVPMVLQNYAWCVVIALFYNLLGNAGLALLNGIVILFFLVTGVLFLKEKNTTILPTQFLPIAVLGFMVLGRYVSLRPEILTCALIVLQLLAMERFKNGGKWAHLLIVPLTMVLESNFHSSYVIMHAFFGVCYILPSIWGMNNTGMNKKKRAYLGVSLGAGILFSFANPYGAKAVFYTYDALKGGFLSKWNIAEQTPISGFSYSFVTVVALVVIITAMTITKKITSPTFYASVPLILLPFAAAKWLSFVPVAMLLLAKDAENCSKFDVLKKSSIVKRGITLLLAVFIVGEAVVSFTLVKNMVLAEKNGNICKEDPFFNNTAQYIAENNPGGVVFANLAYENMYELKGTKVYLDARPELYKGKIAETFLSIMYGRDVLNEDSKNYSLGEYISIIENSDVDYFVVDTLDYFPLYSIGLEESGAYIKNDELSTGRFLFYEKVR